jgi:hypothetical protein
MNLLSLSTAVVWVEFLTVTLAKYVFSGTAVKEWYSKFQSVAILSDYLSVMIGILLGKFLLPSWPLLYSAILVQILHDTLFYYLVLLPMPTGHNAVIDLLKKYAKQSSAWIILYDSFMIGSSVLLYESFEKISYNKLVLGLLVGIYALTYILYTK